MKHLDLQHLELVLFAHLHLKKIKGKKSVIHFFYFASFKKFIITLEKKLSRKKAKTLRPPVIPKKKKGQFVKFKLAKIHVFIFNTLCFPFIYYTYRVESAYNEPGKTTKIVLVYPMLVINEL